MASISTTRLGAFRHLLRRRGALFLGAFFVVDAAVAIACSSSSSVPESDPPDATTDSPSSKDGGLDSTLNPDTSPQGGGHCPPDGSPVTSSPCDLVLDNCGTGQECVLNGTVTECVAVTATEQLPIGHACCPSSAGNPCLPGLTCIGSDCVDAGAAPPTGGGRCTPACCDDKACGKSDPEGISGACDVIIVDNTQTPLYNACTYRQRCQVFQVEPCKNGQGCEVDDVEGTSTCIDTSDAGVGQTCSFRNDCVDGLICAGSGTPGTCQTMCLLASHTSPFDAGLSNAAPGFGGCPTTQICNPLNASNLPTWLGVCGAK